MSSKTAAEPGAHLLFVLSAPSHVEGDLRINWNNTALDNGIGYGKNANSKFKDTLKKYGYKYEASRVVKIDNDGSGSGAGSATASSAPATPKAKKPTVKKPATNGSVKKSARKAPASKKRKIDDTLAENEEEDEDVDDQTCKGEDSQGQLGDFDTIDGVNSDGDDEFGQGIVA